MENWQQYLYDWVDVGDKFVCPTCNRRGNEEPKFFEDWEATPGDGQSECGDRCRCIFLPHEIIALDTSFEGGKSILMRLQERSADFPVSIEFEAATFTKVDELVREYESLSSVYYETGNWNLPEEFYRLNDADEKLKLMNRLIKYIKSGDIPDYLIDDIMYTNRFWMRGDFPKRR